MDTKKTDDRKISNPIDKLKEEFITIKSYFSRLDDDMISQGMPLHYDTALGIWGPSGMDEAFEFFTKMHLEKYSKFVDLGSGDGRISVIASLFTRSCGIESDHDLMHKSTSCAADIASMLKRELECEFLEGDYTKMDLSEFDVLFVFNDHSWTFEFETKLITECKGVLFSYSRVFLPKELNKGKTYWIAGQPIVSYHLNTKERDLFS